MTNGLFTSGETNTDEVKAPEKFLEELVGEGKKFKDPEELAKGKWESDRFIERLQREAEEARAELQKRLTIEEFLKQQSTSNNETDAKNEQPKQDSTSLSKEDILAEVKKLLSTEQAKTQAQRNIERVQEELKKTWGNAFPSKLKARAKELNLDENFLAGLAESRPETFISLVVPKATQTDLSPPSSSRMAPSSGEAVRNKAYYDKLRKENPRMYFSRQIQAQEHKDALTLGDKFYT